MFRPTLILGLVLAPLATRLPPAPEDEAEPEAQAEAGTRRRA